METTVAEGVPSVLWEMERRALKDAAGNYNATANEHLLGAAFTKAPRPSSIRSNHSRSELT
jgi:hypothetical protein